MSIVVAVVGLGLLIAAHEAGHLLLARLMGMRVETYSLGFGPRLWGFRRGDTEYRLSALPLGGYCKIAGFTPDDPAAQDPADTGSYVNKPAWRRFLVIAAGPGVNYLIAFLIIALLYVSAGFVDLTTTRIQVMPGGPAAAAGLQNGDQIVAVDGAKVQSFDDLKDELRKPGAKAERQVMPGGPAAAAGLQNGDQVVAVDGARVQSFDDLKDELRKPGAKADRQVEVLRGGARQSYLVHPDNGTISVRGDPSLVRLPPGEAIPRAAAAVWELNAQQLSGLWDLVRRRGGASLSGPIAIVKQASAEVKRGIADFAQVVAIISVGLALFNFLPVPALDGGRLVFLGIELITRRKVNERIESTVHVIGMLFLLALFLVVVVFGDLGLGKRLFSRG